MFVNWNIHEIFWFRHTFSPDYFFLSPNNRNMQTFHFYSEFLSIRWNLPLLLSSLSPEFSGCVEGMVQTISTFIWIYVIVCIALSWVLNIFNINSTRQLDQWNQRGSVLLLNQTSKWHGIYQNYMFVHDILEITWKAIKC